VSTKSSEQLKNALRATVAQVEQESGVSPDDPALVALKKIVLQRIADLEFAEAMDPILSPQTIDSGAIVATGSSHDSTAQAGMEDLQSKEDKLA